MSGARQQGAWADVRGPRDAAPPAKAVLDEETRALLRLTDMPEWGVLLARLTRQEWGRTRGEDASDASALSLNAGRRSFLHELEGLSERLRNERRGEPGQ